MMYTSKNLFVNQSKLNESIIYDTEALDVGWMGILDQNEQKQQI